MPPPSPHLREKLCPPAPPPHLGGGGHIAFGADLIGIYVGIIIGVIVTLSCLQDILETSGWFLTKFLWIYNWD